VALGADPRVDELVGDLRLAALADPGVDRARDLRVRVACDHRCLSELSPRVERERDERVPQVVQTDGLEVVAVESGRVPGRVHGTDVDVHGREALSRSELDSLSRRPGVSARGVVRVPPLARGRCAFGVAFRRGG
jgi:hypothetical protein